jgi:hypothetical protein
VLRMPAVTGAGTEGSLTPAEAVAGVPPAPLVAPPLVAPPRVAPPRVAPPSVVAPPRVGPVGEVSPSPRHPWMGPVSVLGLRDGQRRAQGNDGRQGRQTEDSVSIGDESSVHFDLAVSGAAFRIGPVPNRPSGI